jgi:hypothetical protein
MSKQFIPAHGGYQKLLSYRKAEIVYDATVYSTNRFYRKGDRNNGHLTMDRFRFEKILLRGSLQHCK